jgi:NTP pyrophosphatase (non-canonical NTP hydrolase)
MDGEQMMKALDELGNQIYENARDKGFHEYTPRFGVAGQDARHILSWLMLIVTELAEAAEEVRLGNEEKFAEEMADVFIRTLDTCRALNVYLPGAVLEKMAKNRGRPTMHGGKLA